MRDQLPEYIFGTIPLFHKKLLKQRPESIIPKQQMNVLHKIKFHPDKPMSYYCEKTMISKPNMSKIVNSLIEEDYVTRTRDEKDRRIVTLSPTEKGLALVKDYFKEMGRQIIESTQVLSDDEIKELIQSFETIREIMEKLETQNVDL